ncbi:hypothetical protein BJI47_16825 [Rhodococcus sp. 1168]|nr:hypothetical protein BJI47_16825 [Rhodococcus sp. 1168]
MSDIVGSLSVRAHDRVGQHLWSTAPSIMAEGEFGESTVGVGPNGDTVEVRVAVNLSNSRLKPTDFGA